MKLIDLTGQRFGRLVVTGFDRRDRYTYWCCVCDCGSECVAASNELRRGKKQSCGCLYADDLTNRRFGRLVVVGSERRGTRLVWRCLCDCGKSHTAQGSHLRHGGVTSCGCAKTEITRERWTKHGLHGSPEYRSWASMMGRCYNEKSRQYRNYGARGITVCPEWHDVANFIHDMGAPPDGMTLERIDNESGYSRGNCTWASKRDQSWNTRRVYGPKQRPAIDVDDRGGRFRCQVGVGQRHVNVGTYDTLDKAVAARNQFLLNLDNATSERNAGAREAKAA